MNLFEKIQAVADCVKNINKDMSVGTGSYAYKAVSDINVTLKVKEAERKYKIVSIPTKQEIVHQEIIKTIGKDNTESIKYSFIIKMTTKIVDLEKTDDFIEVETFGHGLDTGDKGFGKASTYARKYALLNAYKIATGEDPDKDASKQDITPKQISDIVKKVTDFLLNDNKKLQYVLNAFNVGVISDMTDKQFMQVYDGYKKKGLLQ